jgi:altronate dehydratase small subunit
MPDRHIIVVEPTDNVATAIREVNAGETIDIDVGGETQAVTVTDDVPFGHK